MDVYLDRETMQRLRQSIDDAIDENDAGGLQDDLVEIFSEEQIEQLELRIDTGDIHEFITLVLDEWAADDPDELLEILETQLAEADVDFQYFRGDLDDSDDDSLAAIDASPLPNQDDDDDDDSDDDVV